MPSKYAMTLFTLRNMDEKQLLEMFHDMEDIDAVERICECAYNFIENFNYSERDVQQRARDIAKWNGKSDEQDAKDLDDSQRYADIKSELER